MIKATGESLWDEYFPDNIFIVYFCAEFNFFPKDSYAGEDVVDKVGWDVEAHIARYNYRGWIIL